MNYTVMVNHGESWWIMVEVGTNTARGSAAGVALRGATVTWIHATVRTLVRSLFWMNSHVLFGLNLNLLCACQKQ